MQKLVVGITGFLTAAVGGVLQVLLAFLMWMLSTLCVMQYGFPPEHEFDGGRPPNYFLLARPRAESGFTSIQYRGFVDTGPYVPSAYLEALRAYAPEFDQTGQGQLSVLDQGSAGLLVMLQHSNTVNIISLYRVLPNDTIIPLYYDTDGGFVSVMLALPLLGLMMFLIRLLLRWTRVLLSGKLLAKRQ